MLSILKGGLISLTGGTWITGMPPQFFIAQEPGLFGIPAPVYFMVVLTIIVAIWMRYSATRTLLLCGRRQRGSGARLRL